MELTINEISQKIHVIRSQMVMLDSDLAELYETEVKVLNQAVRRNFDRFPHDFRFRLEVSEYECLRSQIVTLERGRGKYPKYFPWVFTEQGVAMISSILNSGRAVQVNIAITRTFVKLRHGADSHADLPGKVEKLEQRFNNLQEEYVSQTRVLLGAIEELKNLSLKTMQSLSVSAKPLLTFEDGIGDSQKHALTPMDNKDRNKTDGPIFRRRTLNAFDTIEGAVAEYYGLKTQDLKNVTRKRTIALPRQIVMYLIRKLLGISFREIGYYFGGKDHTTVLHTYRRIEIGIDKNKDICEAVKSIQHSLFLKLPT